jgi:hypothetical protein
MAASNSVNDVSGWLDERLAAASPDLDAADVDPGQRPAYLCALAGLAENGTIEERVQT